MRTLLTALFLGISLSTFAFADDFSLDSLGKKPQAVEPEKVTCGKSDDIFQELYKDGFMPFFVGDDMVSPGHKIMMVYSTRSNEWKALSVGDDQTVCLLAHGEKTKTNRGEIEHFLHSEA